MSISFSKISGCASPNPGDETGGRQSQNIPKRRYPENTNTIKKQKSFFDTY
jgi:hypothetical protein